ncbi:E3 ubiquitin-protein ligase PUB22-like [Rhododendron vialii]|uniref:E3 ubiquitin-protein ligase PUB22-like n=1 Tax=Rhododendron vialii TaxID=182163 RepID=UPI00265FBB02|nr:E3 ubiquitin-protein ligase PUB22-like [Rhododendron vialii]
MGEIEVPPFFLCPISLEMMKDPVTIPTGITYDRESIEKWLFTHKNKNCPVTKQVLSNPDLTPNHNLRRVIQSWCTLNASHGIERVPTPKPPVNKSQIIKLLKDAKSPQMQIKCLKRLRSIASTSETNKRCIESSGGVDFLASLVKNNNTSTTSLEACDHDGLEFTKPSDEALSIIFSLQLSESALKSFNTKNGEFIESLINVLQVGCYESRAYAVLLLNSILEVEEPAQLVALKPEFFVGLVQILHDQISPKASKAALQLLINVGPWGRNKLKAAEAGTVKVLVDLLLDSSEKRACEMILTALDQLCQCADGRAELLKHGAGLAVVSKKILRVSKVGSERAVRILLSISKYSASPTVVQEMLQLGVASKLCLVLQVDSGSKAKEKAREVLKLHARAWKNCSCIPMGLLSSYPS